MTIFYQPIYWVYRFVSGLWHWLQRRFTLAGLCVLGGVSLLLAPYVIFPGNDTVRYIGAVVALIALYFAFMVSKKGSLATGMASVAAEGEAK